MCLINASAKSNLTYTPPQNNSVTQSRSHSVYIVINLFGVLIPFPILFPTQNFDKVLLRPINIFCHMEIEHAENVIRRAVGALDQNNDP